MHQGNQQVQRSYRKPGKQHVPVDSSLPPLDERSARQLKRHRDLMAQYDEIAHRLVGKATLEVLPGQGSAHDPFMFRPIHKELPRFRGRPTFVMLNVVRHDRLIISEVESYPINGKLNYAVKRWFDFGLPPVRGAEFPRMDGPANHVLLTAGNNLLQELINTVERVIEDLEAPALPQLLIMLDKVRVDETKLAKLVEAINPPELRPVYAQKKRESAEVVSLGELFGDAEVLMDAEIAAGLRQQRAYENYEALLGAEEINPARKIFMAKNPARYVLKTAGLEADWAATADEATVEQLLVKMREALPLPEMAADSDLLDGLTDPSKSLSFTVPVDRLPSSVVLRAMRAAIPAGKAVHKHVTDDELIEAARKPYEPLVVHAYSKIQLVRAEDLRTLPSYATGSFFPAAIDVVAPVQTVELASE
jgi:hypothetical protein